MNIREAIKYLNEHDVKAYELAKESGKSVSSLDKVLKGETKSPHRDTRDFIIGYAESMIKSGKKDLFSIIEESQELYLDQLAIEVRKHKNELLKRTIFKDLIYIEALKMLLEVKDGNTIDVKKLEQLHK